MIQWSLGKCLVLLLVILSSVKGTVITSPPQSVTVPLNEQRVNFTCEGTGDALRWRVAGLTPTDPLNQERDITVTDISTATGNLSSALTIAVLPINDGVVIGCLVYSYLDPFNPVASTSTLTIRGISPIECIQWFTETQTLSWSRPSFYSQDLIEYSQSDTNYNVLVDGISIINTTDTSVDLISSLVNVSCTNFTISITASLEKYVSEEKEEVIDNTGNYSVNILSFTMSYNEAIGCFNVDLTNLLVSSSVQSCNITIIGKLTPDEGIIKDNHYIITDRREKIFSYKFMELKPCQVYAAEVDILNSLNEVEGCDNTTIITYQVQDVLVSEGYTNGSVNVQCVFVSGSTADGCHVIFTDTTNGRNESFNISGSDNTIVSLPTSGHYTVTAVYDIINGNIIPWSCIQPKHVTVHIVSSQSIIRKTSLKSEILPVTILSSSTSIASYHEILTMTSSLPTATTTINSTIAVTMLVVSSAIGAALIVVLILLTITVTIWCVIIRQRKTTEGTITDNPAYGQVTACQPTRQMRTSVNPAYETVMLHHLRNNNTADYEIV